MTRSSACLPHTWIRLLGLALGVAALMVGVMSMHLALGQHSSPPHSAAPVAASQHSESLSKTMMEQDPALVTLPAVGMETAVPALMVCAVVLTAVGLYLLLSGATSKPLFFSLLPVFSNLFSTPTRGARRPSLIQLSISRT